MFLNFVCLAQICGGIVVFYDVYLSLCKRNSKRPSVVAAELGINKSNVSNWKNNGYTPRGEVLQKIADYFGVTTDYLLTGEETKKAPTQEGERWDDPEIYRIPRARKNMTPAEKQKMMNILKASFEDYFSDDYIDDDVDE